MVQTINPHKSRSVLRAIVDTQVIAAGRVLLGLPIEHIFERFRTVVQSDLNRTSVVQIFRFLREKQGIIRCLFSGFSTNVLIQILKQQYRFPLMIFLPKYFHEKIPKRLKEQFPVLHKTLTGISIGLLESFINCPLERIKCIQMTSIKKCPMINYFSTKNFRELYVGYKIFSIKQVVSWVTYLYWDHRIRHHFKRNFDDKLTVQQVFMVSLITGVINVSLVSPFDTVKTLYQMKDSPYQGQSVTRVFSDVIKEQGFKSLYAGWQLKLSQFFTQALLTTPIIDYLERNYGQLEKN